MPPESPEKTFEAIAGGWVDISRPLRQETPVWPGDTPFELDQRSGDDFVLSSFSTTCHVGTHFDAPLHLDITAHGIDGIGLGRCVGPADVVQVPSATLAVEPADLPANWAPLTSRVLFKSDSFPLDAAIEDGFAGLSPHLVDWLADRGVDLIGIDTPSVDTFTAEELPAHRALLNRGLTWIEGLWLGDVEPGSYFLIALPILLEGAEAAPARVILKPIS